MLNIGVIGAGRIGKIHCQNISTSIKNARVKTVADPFMDKNTISLLESYGVSNFCSSYKDVLADPEIDAVLICSSTDSHAYISIEAAQAGKHIFCEKPVDRDINKIFEVLRAVKNSNVKFQVGFNRRFDNNFRAIKDAIAQGKIGDPHIIKITSRDPAPPPISYVKSSGGMFLDMTIHDFDMVRYLSGSEAEVVYAIGGALVDPAIKEEADDIDTAIITIQLTSGAMAVIDNSRKACYGYDQRAEVFGSLGAISVGNNTPSTAVISTAEGVNSEKPLYFFLERYTQSFTDELKSFVSAIENNTPVEVNAFDGLAPVMIAYAAKKSLVEKRPVNLSEMLVEYSKN